MQHFLVTRRVVRQAVANTGRDKFAARHTNQETWYVSGPFVKRSTAERAALAALASHTCLTAEVYTRDQLDAWLNASTYDNRPEHNLGKAIRQALETRAEVPVS